MDGNLVRPLLRRKGATISKALCQCRSMKTVGALTMEVGITNATNAIYDIIELLLLALPDLLATNVVFSPDRIDDLSIKYENQTRQAR